MPFNLIDTKSLAADAVDNTILDLTSNYAFTGTITGAGGSVTKITTVNGAGASEIDFSGNLGSFNYNMIVFKDLVLSGDNNFRMRVFVGGSIQTATAYRFAGKMRSTSGNDSNQNGDGNDSWEVMNAIDDNASGEGNGSMGVIYVTQTEASRHPGFFGHGFQQSHNGNKNAIYYAGHNTAITSAISGLRLYPSSGTFTSIRATLYGVN